MQLRLSADFPRKASTAVFAVGRDSRLDNLLESAQKETEKGLNKHTNFTIQETECVPHIFDRNLYFLEIAIDVIAM